MTTLPQSSTVQSHSARAGRGLGYRCGKSRLAAQVTWFGTISTLNTAERQSPDSGSDCELTKKGV